MVVIPHSKEVLDVIAKKGWAIYEVYVQEGSRGKRPYFDSNLTLVSAVLDYDSIQDVVSTGIASEIGTNKRYIFLPIIFDPTNGVMMLAAISELEKRSLWPIYIDNAKDGVMTFPHMIPLEHTVFFKGEESQMIRIGYRGLLSYLAERFHPNIRELHLDQLVK